MWLVVGLGNPGSRYEGTRHNAGFLVVDELARPWGMSLGRLRLGARTASGTIARSPVLLAQPQQYMNRSGGPTGALQRFHELPVERVVVVHDELDLPFGSLRIKRGGGHGGHNGLRDLHEHVGADFVRVRLGVSRPPEGTDAADWVLSPWADDERAELPRVVERAADAIEAILTDGVTLAMNAFNVRPRRKAGAEEPTTPAGASGTPTPARPDDAPPGATSQCAPRGQGAE